jgi:cellulose synthase/poly-beta-1,6-N-acetylglucosamine synthase-like glycosyltransferase
MEDDRSCAQAGYAEVTMSWQHWIRQSHRWLAIVFTATVLANFVARAMDPGEPSAWITYSPLPPLFLMLFSGLYLFALPYRTKRRSSGPA